MHGANQSKLEEGQASRLSHREADKQCDTWALEMKGGREFRSWRQMERGSQKNLL